MKKVISVLLLLAFVFSMAALTACGEKKAEEEATEAPKRVADGDIFELKDQMDTYAFQLQAYKDSSLTYKMEEYYDRKSLVITSEKGGYTVYVYINNGYRNNYDSKHESGKEDGGKDITIGDYSGYTYPKTVLNAAFIDTGAAVENDADLISLVVEQPEPFEHDINEVIEDPELVELLATLKLTVTPLENK